MDRDDSRGVGLERLKYHAVLNPNIVLPSLSDDSDVTFISMDHLKKALARGILAMLNICLKHL